MAPSSCLEEFECLQVGEFEVSIGARHQFISPIAQIAERLAVNQEVRGSKPRRGANSVLISRSSVAEHRLDKAGVGGSFPPAGTSLVSVWRRWQRA
jgi:hypothetical protein